ncbi:hypothetical protein BBK82_43945 [Lentzea guizhouensis]|uniref:Uncharacterized protein n=1 Tax=Lentzea guizhouensis TaxID=1586287 RepID=A0A1B2HVY0_9PSEU|nr:hypothetical protein [Lentzea guizhouensis]ANZ41858.1 hypothetical protein BBK82_43945 [Lentzea guizhouensis]
MTGLADVTLLEKDIRALRERDCRHSGESCLDRVRPGIRENLPLLDRGRERFGAANGTEVVGWARSFTESDLPTGQLAEGAVGSGPRALESATSAGSARMRDRFRSLVTP